MVFLPDCRAIFEDSEKRIGTRRKGMGHGSVIVKLDNYNNYNSKFCHEFRLHASQMGNKVT